MNLTLPLESQPISRPISPSSSVSPSGSSTPDASTLKRLRSFTDSDLVSQTRMLVRDEAQATRQVLLHLMEIERREIHLARGFKSLHEFAVDVFGYSDGSAARRVAAMRLMRDMPETAEQLVQGTLTLETMSTLQKHFRDAKPSKELRTALVNTAQNLSKRELEKKLGKPEMTAVYLKPEVIEKLKELRMIMGVASFETIIHKLADQALAQARLEKQKRVEKLEKGKAQKEKEIQSTPPSVQKPMRQPAPPSVQTVPTTLPNREPAATDPVTDTGTAPANRSRYVPQPVRKHLIQRDQARCAYVDPRSKRQCTATHHLEFDHVQPFARGGLTTEENLRVLCANHNRFRARRMGLGLPRR
jgi:hypothetical protein